MISWSEFIDIDRPIDQVYPALRDQHILMQWSVWPQATGYTYVVDGDGTSAGSSVIFSAPSGEEAGRQTITAVTATSIHSRLRYRGFGGRVVEPEVDLHAEPLNPGRTRVKLNFRIEPSMPAVLQAVARLILSVRVRPLHRKDLRNLKQLLERAAA